MTKKIKENNEIVITLDKKTQKILGINKQTDFNMMVIDNVLIIKPKKSKSSANEKVRKEITSEIVAKYASVFKKLSKT